MCPDEADQIGRAGGQSLDLAREWNHDWAEKPDKKRLRGIGGQTGIGISIGCMLEGYLIRIVYFSGYYSVWSCEIWDFDSNSILIPTVAIFTENLLFLKILLPANTVALRLFKIQIVQKEQ